MIAETPSYSADAALVELSAGFAGDVSFLRDGLVLRDRDLLTQGATIIKRYAGEPWELHYYTKSGFDLNSAQKTLFMSKPEFGNLLANIVNHLTETDDRSLGAAIAAVAAETDAKAFIVHAFVRLFLAHEFFHIEQRLGSDQYADSDSYLNVVTAVDYQADLVAIDYVFQNIKTVHKADPRSILLLLLAIHIVSMQSFTPSRHLLALDRTSFDRLLVWHFQAARIAGAASAPDLHDPSFKVMPIISFPRLDAAIRHKVELKHIRDAKQPATEVPQDMVVAICGADYVMRILRLAATRRSRVPDLVEALLREQFAGVRNEFEEFFRTHEVLLAVANTHAKQRLLASLQATVTIGDRIIDGDLNEALLTLETPPVVNFLERIQILLDGTDLTSEGWTENRNRLGPDIFATIDSDLDREFGARRAANARKASDRIRREIIRLQIRLLSSIDDLVA
jgi:hypothetical protein